MAQLFLALLFRRNPRRMINPSLSIKKDAGYGLDVLSQNEYF